MFGKIVKIGIATSVAAVVLVGCQGGMRGPQVFAGFNGNADCPPGPKPCPRDLYPEFPLPPGGPYLQTPGYAPQPGPQGGSTSRMNINNSSDKLTLAK